MTDKKEKYKEKDYEGEDNKVEEKVVKSFFIQEEDPDYEGEDDEEEYDEENGENIISDILCQTRDSMLDYVNSQGIPLCQKLSYNSLYDFAKQF